MFSDDLPINPLWRKSTRCDNSGPNCVEVRIIPEGGVDVRNTQRPEVMTSFNRDEWRAFVDGVKAGEFDV